MCQPPQGGEEGKKWLNCLSIISAFLDDTGGQLELFQIQASCCPGLPALAMCVQVEPSIPGHQAGMPALQAPLCLRGRAIHSWTFCASVFSTGKTHLYLTAPPPLLSSEQFSVTATSFIFLTLPSRSRGQRLGQPCSAPITPGREGSLILWPFLFDWDSFVTLG